VTTSTGSRRGSAPGRLDLLGGVADYSGALVLEIPTRVQTTVLAEPHDALVVGAASLTVDEVIGLSRAPYDAMRAALAPHPRWTHYVLGVALVLVRHAVIDPPRARLTVSSDVPQSIGVSSSAALEVATARALVDEDVDSLRVATLCQEAENQVVGAPCGIMDQVAVAMGVPGAVLPILCRPASVSSPIPLPADVEVVGWPTGAEHDVSGAPYRRARVAAFMGKRIVEATTGRAWSFVSELPPDALDTLPASVGGAEFVDRWGNTDDTVTTLAPDETYPVRAATRFGVEEHARATRALRAVEQRDLRSLGELMGASHAGYDAMGLGHPAATAARDDARARPGVHGARSSGGGCGGTVVVMCDRGALDEVDHLIR
jgi:L-arabinokinase